VGIATRVRATVPLVLVLVLAACSIATVETPDPAAIPSGSLVPSGDDATGPVIELGSSNAQGVGWRYSIYPSGDAWCTQLETALGTSTGCGDILPSGDAAFGSVGVMQGDEGRPDIIEGMATEETFTVWLVETESQRRFPATLMPLDEADLDGVAFVGVPPADMTVTHLLAMASSGEILETYELP
jgi:hypothetical protein